jgi:hypothetical protein
MFQKSILLLIIFAFLPIAAQASSIDDEILAPKTVRTPYFSYKVKAGLFIANVIETLIIHSQQDYLGLTMPKRRQSRGDYLRQNLSDAFPLFCKWFGIKNSSKISKIPWYQPTNPKGLGIFGAITAQNYAILASVLDEEKATINARDAFLIGVAGYVAGYLLYLGYALAPKLVSYDGSVI